MDKTMDKGERLAILWVDLKAAEQLATTRRREVEDEIAEHLAIKAGLSGTETAKAGRCTIKISGRIDRKVDADRLQELAYENGLSDWLPALFRWKPEVNMVAWNTADESIKNALAGAITATPGRPSFSIVIKE